MERDSPKMSLDTWEFRREGGGTPIPQDFRKIGLLDLRFEHNETQFAFDTLPFTNVARAKICIKNPQWTIYGALQTRSAYIAQTQKQMYPNFLSAQLQYLKNHYKTYFDFILFMLCGINLETCRVMNKFWTLSILAIDG